jgi:ribonuclease T1
MKGAFLSVLLCVLGIVAVPAPLAWAREAPPLREVRVDDLPPEARETLALVRKGGPFPYSKDGATFGNFERHLPSKARGYYREYTVRTPGAKDRGARRIVAGAGASGDVRNSGEYYYTEDHYRSFKRIRE